MESHKPVCLVVCHLPSLPSPCLPSPCLHAEYGSLPPPAPHPLLQEVWPQENKTSKIKINIHKKTNKQKKTNNIHKQTSKQTNDVNYHALGCLIHTCKSNHFQYPSPS